MFTYIGSSGGHSGSGSDILFGSGQIDLTSGSSSGMFESGSGSSEFHMSGTSGDEFIDFSGISLSGDTVSGRIDGHSGSGRDNTKSLFYPESGSGLDGFEHFPSGSGIASGEKDWTSQFSGHLDNSGDFDGSGYTLLSSGSGSSVTVTETGLGENSGNELSTEYLPVYPVVGGSKFHENIAGSGDTRGESGGSGIYSSGENPAQFGYSGFDEENSGHSGSGNIDIYASGEHVRLYSGLGSSSEGSGEISLFSNSGESTFDLTMSSGESGYSGSGHFMESGMGSGDVYIFSGGESGTETSSGETVSGSLDYSGVILSGENSGNYVTCGSHGNSGTFSSGEYLTSTEAAASQEIENTGSGRAFSRVRRASPVLERNDSEVPYSEFDVIYSGKTS